MNKPSGVMSNQLSDPMTKYVRDSFDQKLRESMDNLGKNMTATEVNERMKAMSTGAPWKDFEGNNIYDGDNLVHPSGQRGLVMFKPGRDGSANQWVVDYGGGIESRLCLQVGDRGMGVVTQTESGRKEP